MFKLCLEYCQTFLELKMCFVSTNACIHGAQNDPIAPLKKISLMPEEQIDLHSNSDLLRFSIANFLVFS